MPPVAASLRRLFIRQVFVFACYAVDIINPALPVKSFPAKLCKNVLQASPGSP